MRDTHEYRIRYKHYLQLMEMIADTMCSLEQYVMAAKGWEEIGDSLLVEEKKKQLKELLETRRTFEEKYILDIL